METYLMMLYVTLDQESALKKYFDEQGWSFSKPDLSALTDKLGPTIYSNTKEPLSHVTSRKKKASFSKTKESLTPVTSEKRKASLKKKEQSTPVTSGKKKASKSKKKEPATLVSKVKRKASFSKIKESTFPVTSGEPKASLSETKEPSSRVTRVKKKASFSKKKETSSLLTSGKPDASFSESKEPLTSVISRKPNASHSETKEPSSPVTSGKPKASLSETLEPSSPVTLGKPKTRLTETKELSSFETSEETKAPFSETKEPSTSVTSGDPKASPFETKEPSSPVTSGETKVSFSEIKEPSSPVTSGKRKASLSPTPAPRVKIVKIVPGSCRGPVRKGLQSKCVQTKNTSNVGVKEEIQTIYPLNTDSYEKIKLDISDVISELKKGEHFNVEDHGEEPVRDDIKEVVDNDNDDADRNNDLYDVGDEENDDTDESIEDINDEGKTEKLDGTNSHVKLETLRLKSRKQTSVRKGPTQTYYEEHDSDDDKTIETQENVVNRLLYQSQQQGDIYKCCICSKEIKIKYNMKRHLRTHLPDQINCNLCNRFFETSEKRDEHMKKRHSNRHMCETCGISFKRKSDLNLHMIKHESAFEQETAPNCFKCTHKGCGKLFFRQTNYEYHLNAHSGIKPYECCKCLKLFHSKYTKNEHEKDCINDTEYRCEICGSMFKQKSGLHNHMQAEHVRQEKGFSCDVCSQMFKFLSGLIRHKKEKHKQSDASQQTDTTSVMTLKTDSDVKTQTEIITPMSNTAYIVVTDIDPELKNTLNSGKDSNDVTMETSVVEEITEANAADIITEMSEQQGKESSGDINIERVIVVHQVASDLPQHIHDVNH